MIRFHICFTILVGLFSPATPSFLKNEPTYSTSHSTQDYLVKTFNSLEKILEFFLKEYKNVNLDAVIGSRIVEASFNVLQKRLNTSNVLHQLPPFILSRIQHLRDMASEFSDMATPYVIANDPLYYSNIGQTIEKGLFELNYETRDVSRQVILWPHTSHESMDEEDSDYCLGEIFGTRDNMECAFTDKCWSLMTKFGYNGYSLSHEIFFLEIAEGYGCHKEIQQQIVVHKQPSLTQLHDTFCANMLDEANRIAEMGFPPSRQDLFMEQAALCGLLGFREFFNNDWLKEILSWQDTEDGCYKWSGWNPEDFSSRSAVRHTRNKREEKRVYRGCLCHRSTVAASALSQYVRYILEVWLKEHM